MLKLFKIHIIFTVFTISILAQSSGRDSVFTDEILVESNRVKMTTSRAPNKIQVIDSKLLGSMNSSRLNDALEMSDASFIKDYGFNSGIKIISLNATQSEHTLILLNGIRLNSRQNAQVDLSLYDLDNASRIEISKGGSSALYGSEAIGGVINIVTQKTDLSKPFSFNLKAILGSYGLRKFYGKISNYFDLGIDKSISYNVSYSDERAENNYEYYFKSGLTEVRKERENSAFNSQVFNFNGEYIANDETSWKILASYSHFDRGVPGVDLGYSPGTAKQIDYNFISGIVYENELSDELFIKHSLSYKYQHQKYFDTTTFNLPVKIDSYYRLFSGGSSSVLSYLPSNVFNLETGIELNFDKIVSNETDTGSATLFSVFTAAKYELKNRFIPGVIIYPSVRYDYYSNINEKNVVTGKFGVNIKPFKQIKLNIKSSVGNNFRAPTFNELYWKNLGNKNLKPERSISFDAGVLYQFKTFLQNEIELSYFNVNTTDRIVWTPVSGIWRPINVGKVTSSGIEVSFKSELISNKGLNLSLSLNYSYGTAIKKNSDFPGDPSYNKQMIYIPKEMIKTAFMFNYLTTSKLLKLVSFNLFYRFATRRYMNFENTVFEPRYDVLDANMNFGLSAFSSELNLKIIVNNVFDEDYKVISGYPMPLRNYKFEISYKY